MLGAAVDSSQFLAPARAWTWFLATTKLKRAPCISVQPLLPLRWLQSYLWHPVVLRQSGIELPTTIHWQGGTVSYSHANIYTHTYLILCSAAVLPRLARHQLLHEAWSSADIFIAFQITLQTPSAKFPLL